jgi:hypothetical protein
MNGEDTQPTCPINLYIRLRGIMLDVAPNSSLSVEDVPSKKFSIQFGTKQEQVDANEALLADDWSERQPKEVAEVRVDLKKLSDDDRAVLLEAVLADFLTKNPGFAKRLPEKIPIEGDKVKALEQVKPDAPR